MLCTVAADDHVLEEIEAADGAAAGYRSRGSSATLYKVAAGAHAAAGAPAARYGSRCSSAIPYEVAAGDHVPGEMAAAGGLAAGHWRRSSSKRP
eukprot:scaffold304379_cov27-Tisochrysis_lutea.AAC.4